MKNNLFTIFSLSFFLSFQVHAQTIYELYTQGGAGGTWASDYIILSGFTASQSVVGKSVQYRGTGTGWTVISLTGNADATGFYRIWLSASASGAPWTPQLLSGAVNMTNSNSGQVALMSNTTTITIGTCPSGGMLHDLVGYIGSTSGVNSSCFEGTGSAPATSSSGTQSSRRFQETNNNAVDFTLITSPYLPIELISFKATLLSHGNRLDWQTATEQNNRGFEVQRSSNNTQWEIIHFENGHGTSTQTHEYSFLDEKPLAGRNYYRLRQLDTDGRFDYSPIVSVEMNGSGNSIRFSPNPARQGIASLFFSEIPETDCVLEIFDGIGRMTYHQNIQLGAGNDFSMPIDLSHLSPGIYTARLGLNNAVLTERLVITK